jgi:hypothetical protein
MTELETFLEQIRWVLDQQSLCLAGLSAEQLVWKPPLAGGNSVAAIVGHTVGVTRSFVLGVVGGQAIARDRPSEFATVYAGQAEATAVLDSLQDELRELAARSLDPSQLVTPSAAAWGSEPDGPMPRRVVLAEALRHAAIHLGELRFTRGLIEAAGTAASASRP